MARKDEVAKPKLEEKPERDDRCIAEYAGMRCCYPWSISNTTSGKKGWCRHHFGLEPGPRYLEIVEQSAAWAAAREALA